MIFAGEKRNIRAMHDRFGRKQHVLAHIVVDILSNSRRVSSFCICSILPEKAGNTHDGIVRSNRHTENYTDREILTAKRKYGVRILSFDRSCCSAESHTVYGLLCSLAYIYANTN